MKKKLIVQKFGGTSVGSTERIKAVAERAIKTKKSIKDVVIVVSAMGDATNQLVKLAKDISIKPNSREYDALIQQENVSASLLAMCLHEKGKSHFSIGTKQAFLF